MVSMRDVVMVCQEAVSDVPHFYERKVVEGVLFGMVASGLVTIEQRKHFRDRLKMGASVGDALSQMVVLDMEWGD